MSDSSGNIINLVYTKWDSKLNNWSNQSDLYIYQYDNDGTFVATEQFKINNNREFIASK
ncbi:hypothetical protein [Prevotella sp. 10(H)]|uniref:hypothetical protein n=1 Tax=Prevotella sp. 10(H) TaxID=1158294 RepID=UPI000A9EAC61|nr:hypothetical protein [Prevotella sp. 10(H)]